MNDMKRLRFIPMSWSPDQATHPVAAAEPGMQGGRQQLGGERRERTPQPEKLVRLREYLSNIEKTPIQRVRASEFSC